MFVCVLFCLYIKSLTLLLLLLLFFTVCKLRLEQEVQTEEALGILKNVLTLVDQGDLLPHLKAPSQPKAVAKDGRGAEEEEEEEVYTQDHLTADLDLLRQLMRTTIELVAVGMVTRSQKLISFVESSLQSIAEKPLVQGEQVDRTSYSLSAIALRAKVDKELPSLWCQLAGTYESLELPDKALRCYQASLTMCANHAVSLREFARLAHADFPGEVPNASELLKAHFEYLVEEFQTLRQQHGGEVGASAGASGGAASASKHTRSRKRPLDQDSNAASFDKLRRTVDASFGDGSSSSSVVGTHVRPTEHASLPVQDDDDEGEGESEEITYDQSEFVEDNDNDELAEEESDADDGEGELDELDSDLGGDGDEDDRGDDEVDEGKSGVGGEKRYRLNDDEEEDAADEQQQQAQWHWRAANKSVQFTQVLKTLFLFLIYVQGNSA